MADSNPKVDHKAIIEALLMATDRALTVSEMIKIVSQRNNKLTKENLLKIIAQLQSESAGHAYELKEVASGYRYQTRVDYKDWLAKLWEQKPPRYSRAALETLALIAYRQPITRAEIEEVRGVAVSSNIIHAFEDRAWIKVVGHKETPGRPGLYATTKNFLDDLGLKSLDDLPELPELGTEATAAAALHLVPDENEAAADAEQTDDEADSDYAQNQENPVSH